MYLSTFVSWCRLDSCGSISIDRHHSRFIISFSTERSTCTNMTAFRLFDVFALFFNLIKTSVLNFSWNSVFNIILLFVSCINYVYHNQLHFCCFIALTLKYTYVPTIALSLFLNKRKIPRRESSKLSMLIMFKT